MNAIAPAIKTPLSVIRNRRAGYGDDPGVLADIYQEDINIAIWQRELTGLLRSAVSHVLESKPNIQLAVPVSAGNAYTTLIGKFGTEQASRAFAADIAELVDMFCCLFELEVAGLRLTALYHAMCPRFHVDKVPCRLVTTYAGNATEWLPHDRIDRGKLGAGSQGLADNQSGLYTSSSAVQQLSIGEVALLKGESWIGNENAGLVHRSPQLKKGESRLLLTLDIVNP